MGNNFSIYINMSTALEKAFYQNRDLDMNYGPSRRTRLRCKHGTTGTCYLAQKLDLITGSILSLPEKYKIKYLSTGLNVSNIANLTFK